MGWNGDTPRDNWQRQVRQETACLQAISAGEAVTATISLLTVGSRWAVVEVVTPPAPDRPAYRQTRVYVESEWGWVRVAPRAAHWGRPQRLESDYFTFHYYARDAEAVAGAAALLDAAYPALYAAFFPEPPGDPKWVVEVTPEQRPGVMDEAPQYDTPLVTASPGVYLAPDTVSDRELLAQALLLDLLKRLSIQARARYALDSYWLPVLDGVVLWQLWESGLPLAAWREPLVRLIYPVSSGPAATLDSDFCAEFSLWMVSPLDLHIPLLCQGRHERFLLLGWGDILALPLDTALPGGWVTPSALARLLRGRELLDDVTYTVPLHPGTAIAVASALAYAAEAYGPQTIPALLDALAEHDTWTAIPPAVFGVSAEEFDAGWHGYLEQHDDLSP